MDITQNKKSKTEYHKMPGREKPSMDSDTIAKLKLSAQRNLSSPEKDIFLKLLDAIVNTEEL